MGNLSEDLVTVTQRTGSNVGRLRTDAQRSAFLVNVQSDIASIMGQMNNVYYPLLNSLASIVAIEALDFGIAGNSVYTDVSASASSGSLYWDSVNSRTKTLKESFDTVLSEIVRLEAIVSTPADAFDDTALVAATDNLELNAIQLRLDTMGGDYAFDLDGLANLDWSLAEHIEAIGAFFTGFPGTGITFTPGYPSLSFAVNLSDINIDTTLPQTTITSLPTHLAAIRTFVGMGSATDTTVYSAHGALTYVADGQSLEQSIRVLDDATADLQTLSGVAIAGTDLGTFTGSTIADTRTVKQALQDLETGFEDFTGLSRGINTGTYSVDFGDTMWCNTSGGTFTLNLPAPVSGLSYRNRRVIIIDAAGNAAANNITVNTDSGSRTFQVGGGVTKTLATNNGRWDLEYNATSAKWHIILSAAV